MKYSYHDHLLLLLVTVTWGFSYVAVKLALREIDGMAFYAFRNGIGMIAVLVAFRATQGRWRLRGWGDLGRLAYLGAIGVTINQFTYIVGMTRTSAANASLLVATAPVFGLAFGMLLFREKAGTWRWTGVGLALVGTALIVLGGGGEFRVGVESIGGDLLVLASGASFALFSVLSRPLLRHYTAMQVTTYTFVIGASGSLSIGAPSLFEQHWLGLSALGWAMALFAAVNMSFTAFVWNRTVAKVGASTALVYTYLTPVFAVLFAVLFLRETLSILQIAGAVVVLAGVNLARNE